MCDSIESVVAAAVSSSCDSEIGRSRTSKKSTIEHAQEAATARMQGQWLCWRKILGPRNAISTLAAKGKSGTSHRQSAGSNMAGLLGLKRFDAGWRERW